MASAEWSFDLRAHRRITAVWLALTVLTAISVVALFVTLPVLAALLAQQFVRPRRAGSAVLAWCFGPMLMIGVGWFALRVDEVPGEGAAAALLAVIGLSGLLLLRRHNGRP